MSHPGDFWCEEPRSAVGLHLGWSVHGQLPADPLSAVYSTKQAIKSHTSAIFLQESLLCIHNSNLANSRHTQPGPLWGTLCPISDKPQGPLSQGTGLGVAGGRDPGLTSHWCISWTKESPMKTTSGSLSLLSATNRWCCRGGKEDAGGQTTRQAPGLGLPLFASSSRPVPSDCPLGERGWPPSRQ